MAIIQLQSRISPIGGSPMPVRRHRIVSFCYSSTFAHASSSNVRETLAIPSIV